MAKIRGNSTLMGLEGKFGTTHAYRKVDGKMHVVALPDRRQPLTPAQTAVTERFVRAGRYAKGQMNDPATRALYETGITARKRSAYAVALTDWLNAPEVNGIKTEDYRGAVGDVISIEASDDFKVVRVRVIIKGSDGSELERGEAIQDSKNEDTWKYTATAVNPGVAGSIVSVTAFDTPDNETSLDVVL